MDTLTREEHVALTADAVERATADKDAEITELQNKLDVLEAEKATEVERAEKAERELSEFKSEVEVEREVASRRDARVDQIAQITRFGQDYFTDERVQRWAAMDDEHFDELATTLLESTVASLGEEQAKQLEGLDGDARVAKVKELIKASKQEPDQTGRTLTGGPNPKTHIIHETAAFRDGQNPTGETKPAGSLKSFFGARGLLPTPSQTATKEA